MVCPVPVAEWEQNLSIDTIYFQLNRLGGLFIMPLDAISAILIDSLAEEHLQRLVQDKD
jgi:hypothetical protein